MDQLEQRCLLASISGTLLNDLNGNGAPDAGETPLSGWTVYLDQNKNRKRDSGETSTTTNGSGQYSFASLTAGTYYVSQEVPVGWDQTYPNIAHPGVNESGGGSIVAKPVLSTTGSGAAAEVMGELDENGDPTPSDLESNSLIRLNNFRADGRFTGIDGTGFSVAILDTGIDVNHPMFGPDADANGVADRIKYQWDFADNDADASDVNGHGSNVSSIAAGSDPTNSGMAPNVGIIALKVFKNTGSGLFSYTEAALQWVVANAATYNIAAVNMSLGDSQNWATPQALYGLNDELAALAAQNVIVVSAAGNSYKQFQAPGTAYPAADANSLAIGAVYDANLGQRTYSDGANDLTTAADRVTSFSQRSTSMVDVFAPGASITGANATGGTTSYSGTSQATPHITGIAALAQQLAMQRLGRRLTPAEFTQLLKDTATTIYDGDDENDNVTNLNADLGRVDVLKLGDAIYNMGTGEYYPLGHKVVLTSASVRTGLNFGAKVIGQTATGTPTLRIESDSGRFNNDNITNLDNSTAAKKLQFTVPGVIPGTTVTLYADGVAVGSAVATASVAPITTDGVTDVVDGARSFTAKQQAPAMAASVASAVRTITIDTIAPPPPTAFDLSASSDTGVSSTDNITNDTTPTFTFNIGVNLLRVYRDNVLISDPYSSTSTSFTPTGFVLPDGTNNYVVSTIDPAGNEAPAPPLSVTIDTNPYPTAAPIPGAFDTSFGAANGTSISTGSQDIAYAMARASDGKIVVVGSMINLTTNETDVLVLRFLANGAPDTTFGTAGRATAHVRDLSEATTVAVQPDGKIVVGAMIAYGARYGGYEPRGGILRFTAAGALDTTFGVGGVFTATTYPMTNNGEPGRLIIQPDGKILAAFDAGSNGNWADYGVSRLTSAGVLDTTFSGDGYATFDFTNFMDEVSSMEMLPDGKMLIIGSTRAANDGTPGKIGLMRVLPDGSPDTTFDGDGKLTTAIPITFVGTTMRTALQADGKLLVAGYLNGVNKQSLLRLDPTTGLLDSTFGTGGIVSFPQYTSLVLNQIAVQTDGKIVVAGNVTGVYRSSSTASDALFRFESNGAPDKTFGMNGVASAYLNPVVGSSINGDQFRGMALLPDGSYVVAATLTMPYDGTFPSHVGVAHFFGGTAPAAQPVDLQAASDLGTSSTDNLTSDNTPTFDLPNLAGGYARIYRDGVLASASYQSGTSWTPGTALPNGTSSYSLRYVDAAGNETDPAYSAAPLAVTIDAVAPTVTGVFVGSTAWNPSFRTFLQTSAAGESAFGYRILATEQTDELPWMNLNQISIRFSENVNVAADDLIVRGVTTPVYDPATSGAFSYDAATFTATWTLATAGIGNEKLLLELDADANGVADQAGNRLDGEWTNPIAPAISADTYPSGNGAAGGDFLFRMNVLPGDVNRSGGSVTGSDVTLVRNAQNFSPGSAGYKVFYDVNGSNSILGSDVTLVRNNQGKALPTGEPSVPAGLRKIAASLPVLKSLAPIEPTTRKRLADGLL